MQEVELSAKRAKLDNKDQNSGSQQIGEFKAEGTEQEKEPKTDSDSQQLKPDTATDGTAPAAGSAHALPASLLGGNGAEGGQ